MQIMNMTGYVFFWYLLGLKLTWGHAHKTRSWYLLGVTSKKPDEHPRHFYMGVPPPPGEATTQSPKARQRFQQVYSRQIFIWKLV